MDKSNFSDEMLTAFLDGEADAASANRIMAALKTDPKLAKRIEALEIPKPMIRSAFDIAMQAAPVDRLEKTLDIKSANLTIENTQRGRRAIVKIAAVAAVLAFALGLATGRFSWQPAGGEDWRVSVAEYQALYSPETLRSIVTDAVESHDSIRHVAAQVGAPIEPAVLQGLNGVQFKRAQVLRWRDDPLAQFAFLTHEGVPLAFCATPTQEANQPFDHQVLKGLASSSWVADGVAYMVIGGEDALLVKALAEQLRRSI
ncbi:MAG: hypothetical protein AAGA73_09215 [Pseudomonadota bacterium]